MSSSDWLRYEADLLAVGQRPHMCIGAGLARMATRIALQVLAQHVSAIIPASTPGSYTRSYIIRGPLELRAGALPRA